MNFFLFCKVSLFVILILCNASASEINFYKLGKFKNIQTQPIRAISKDNMGYLWVATNFQLWRYDSYQSYLINEIYSIPGNVTFNGIKKIIFDASNSLWVGTQNEGLYKVSHGEVLNFKYNSNSKTISSNLVSALTVDSTSGLWVGTNNGLNYLSASLKFTHYSLKTDKSNNEKYITSILNVNNNELFVGTKAGLFRFEKNSGVYSKITLSPDEKETTIYSIYKDSQANIWVASQLGVFVKNRLSNSFQPYKKDIFNQVVTAISSDISSIWIATFYNGLYQISKQTGLINNYSTNKNNPQSLSANTISSLHLDNSDIMWVNTLSGGLNYFSTNSLKFGLHKNTGNSVYCASENFFTDFKHDTEGNLWLLVDNELIKFNENERSCKSYKIDSNTYGKTQKNTLFSLKFSTHLPDIIWLSSYKGLLAFNKSTQFLDTSHLNKTNKAIYFIHEFDESNLLLGTNKGLYIYNYRLKKLKKINADEKSLYDASIYSHTILQNQSILLATSDGVATLDKNRQIFTKHKLIQKHLATNRISSIYSDINGNIWVGVSSNGLYKFDNNGTLLKNYNEVEQLAKIKNIHSFLNSNNDLWMGTGQGLVRLNLKTDSIDVYNENDGLQGNYFNPSAAYSTPDGKLYFGGRNGYNAFYPADISLNVKESDIVLTSLLRFGKIIIPKKKYNTFSINNNIDAIEHLVLRHDDYVIGFEFSQLNYIKTYETQYAYKLEGFDPDWNYVNTNSRKAIYTNLPAGEFTLRIKSSLNHAKWIEREKKLKITVLPAPWFTWWAFVLYFSMFFFLISWLIRQKTKANREINLRLRQEVENRTNELMLEKQKVEALLVRKNQLFENISHEFRTPLTLILGPIEKLRQLSTKKNQNNHIINIIKNNANRLLTMVEHLMQITKFSQTSNIKLITVQTNIIITKLIESFQILAERKRLTLELTKNDSATIEIYQDTLDIVLGNLISNAIKYTAIGGSVTMCSQIVNNYLHISITDTGCGLTQQQQTVIFQRFKRLEIHRNIQGIGLGLSVVKELLTMNDVKIKIDSKIGEGSTFSMKFKICRPNPSVIENPPSLLTTNHLYQDKQLTNISANKVKPNQNKNRATVLIIEDNLDMAQYIVSILEPVYNCIVANEGKQLIKLAITVIPNFIICDIMMPILDGYQVSHMVRSDKLTSHIPIVLLTALSDKKSKIKGWQKHIDLYLTKPFDEDELLIQLDNILVIRNILKEKANNAINSLSISQNSGLSKVEQKFLNQLFDVIKDNYRNPNFLRMHLSKTMALSERQLQRKTKDLIDENPMDMLRDYRLECAKKLLKDGFRVSATANECGFNSITYFSYRFKNKYGITPSEYKKVPL